MFGTAVRNAARSNPIRSTASVTSPAGDAIAFRGRQEPAIHVNESIPTYLLAPHTSPHDAVRAAASSHSDAISSGVMRAPAVDETLAAAQETRRKSALATTKALRACKKPHRTGTLESMFASLRLVRIANRS